MRKLFITCCSLGRGGAERVLSILSTPFADEFSHVEILTWRSGPVLYDYDVRVKIISIKEQSKSNNLFIQMMWFRKYVKRYRPDMILSFLATFNMLTLTSLLFNNTKIIVAERIDPSKFKRGKFLSFIRNLLYIKADGILVQTQCAKDYFNPILRKKTKIIYNPIILPNDKIAVWSIEKTDKVIITAARLEAQKNQKMLIEAFSRFHTKYKDYKLIIFGEGKERHNLEELIKNKEMTNFILLPGTSVHIWDEMLKSRLFILSSNYEGMSNSLIEAMCLGLPCISTKVSGSVDLITDGYNGALIDVNDVDALYQTMTMLIDDKEESIRLSKNASSLLEKLKVDVISKQWISYLNSKMNKENAL